MPMPPKIFHATGVTHIFGTDRVPRVGVVADPCLIDEYTAAQVSEYRDLWHPAKNQHYVHRRLLAEICLAFVVEFAQAVVHIQSFEQEFTDRGLHRLVGAVDFHFSGQ